MRWEELVSSLEKTSSIRKGRERRFADGANALGGGGRLRSFESLATGRNGVVGRLFGPGTEDGRALLSLSPRKKNQRMHFEIASDGFSLTLEYSLLGFSPHPKDSLVPVALFPQSFLLP